MSATLKVAALAAFFAVCIPEAQAQEAAPFNRAAAIQQVTSTWGRQAGPADQFQATLNAASDGVLAQLQSATNLQHVRAILLGNLASQAGGSGVMALGDSSQDLTFTPNNPPCRVFDTRFIGAGTAPGAASTSSYQVYGSAGTIAAQGGNPAGCAAPKGEPVAVSANFTAVPVGFQGHIRVFPFGGTLPTVSFVNFNGVVGNNIANAGIVSTCYFCLFDLSVYNGSQTHHIGDVMGYFYPATFGNIDLPHSTTLTGNILKNGTPFIHTYGSGNTFVGVGSGNFTMTGTLNTASGASALNGNTTGCCNTASGGQSLFLNQTGYANTASGTFALYNNASGNENTAIGEGALAHATTGNGNTAVGTFAGFLQSTGSANIYLSNEGVAGESNTIRIGSTHIGDAGYFHNRFFAVGIRSAITGIADAVPVIIDSSGQLGTASSSRRVKQDIADMGESSSVLMDLRPVTFRYTAHGDDPTVQYGLIAEEVAEVAPGLVARTADGAAETVYYQHLTPMLLNEYQKQQARIAELERQVTEIAELRQQTARMAELIERLGRVDAIAGR